MAEQANIEQFIRSVNQEYIKSMERINTIEKILRKAIETDGFIIQYQPIYSVHQNRFASAEALVRLKDTTTLGYISPEEFITIAERKGMISELGAIVFEKVCIFMKSNQLNELGVSYIEINLSGIQCMDNNLPNQLHTIMKKYEIEPQCINLEITETASVETGELLHTNMKKLRSIGCSFSMDDFGTGYSNLSQMADLSYDLVKIDKSLLWRCFENNNEKAVILLQNVITMLISLNTKIVVEGVETKEQAEWLSKIGADYLQGYFYSKPISENEYITFLNQLQMLSS
jgi:EAL domain-containing protein (putative c-di-GMP-specific phosphodiesterase class I)